MSRVFFTGEALAEIRRLADRIGPDKVSTMLIHEMVTQLSTIFNGEEGRGANEMVIRGLAGALLIEMLSVATFAQPDKQKALEILREGLDVLSRDFMRHAEEMLDAKAELLATLAQMQEVFEKRTERMAEGMFKTSSKLH